MTELLPDDLLGNTSCRALRMAGISQRCPPPPANECYKRQPPFRNEMRHRSASAGTSPATPICTSTVIDSSKDIYIYICSHPASICKPQPRAACVAAETDGIGSGQYLCGAAITAVPNMNIRKGWIVCQRIVCMLIMEMTREMIIKTDDAIISWKSPTAPFLVCDVVTW